jgi:ABC-2 type transport system permease protein
MRLRYAMVVARTDLKCLFRSRYYWIPMTILSGLLFVVIPVLSLSIAARATSSPMIQQISDTIQALPPKIQENILGDTPGGRAAYALAVFLLAPIAIVVPMTVSSAVGANAIVGERERGTGEFLAHSPLTEKEIYFGKLVASLVPVYITLLAGFFMYSLVVNLIVGPHVGGWFFPTAGWWLLILWVMPPLIAASLSVIIHISARVRTAAAAHQASTLVTLPVILISYSISMGLLYYPALSAFLVGIVAWILAWFSLELGARAVRRELLLGFGAEK